MSDARSVLRIGEVSRRTGVAVPTLRAWERRYGLLTPARTDGGHRLYSEDDVARVRGMQHLLDDGWSAAAAAREVLRDPAASVTRLASVRDEPTGDQRELTDRIARSLDRFDAIAVDELFDDALARLDVPTVLEDVVLPLLRRLGEGWQDDPRVIAREHFATSTLRPRLQRLLRTETRASARDCLAAAPEGEDHDLGLLCSAAAAAHAGWRVHYLGARVPTAAMERVASELRPDVVLVGAVFREQAESFLADRPDFPRSALVLCGAGFIPSDASRVPGSVVHDGALGDVPATFERAVGARGTA